MKTNTVLHIPHASTVIPEEYLRSFHREKLPQEIRVMTDWFCDELFPCDRERVVFPVSRLVCDVERFRNDAEEIMAEIGMGVTYTTCSDRTPLRNLTEEEKEALRARYYDPHHRALADAVRRKTENSGYAILVDCHSFFPEPLPYERDQEKLRPDICLGTDPFHTPKGWAEYLKSFLEEEGYSVALNRPFAGTLVPMADYRTNPRVFSLMIEVNRGLYCQTPGVKNAQFSQIARRLARTIDKAEEFIEKNCV